MYVSIGGKCLDLVTLDIKDRDIQSAASEIEDKADSFLHLT